MAACRPVQHQPRRTARCGRSGSLSATADGTLGDVQLRKAQRLNNEDTALNERRDAPTLGPVLEFMRLVWAVDHGLDRISKRMEAELGVTGPQRLAIRIVGRFPWIGAGDLAAILHVHPSTLTGILHRLKSRGLLVRSMDPHDGRRILLALTPEGKRCNGRKTGTIEQIIEKVLGACSRQEIAATSVVLARLASALEAEFDDER
jgi:DNA-binding MarR family transcriptional regulator